MSRPLVDLGKYGAGDFARGRSRLVEGLWILVSACFVDSRIPGSLHRRALLRLFGARIAKKVVVKPRTRIKFPWRLTVGENSWIGEGVWIDNLAEVSIGANSCISQDAYLCAGSHDWASPTFDLIVAKITVRDFVWISAKAMVGPGVCVGEGSVLSFGSVATKDLEPWGIYGGNPAVWIKGRAVKNKFD